MIHPGLLEYWSDLLPCFLCNGISAERVLTFDEMACCDLEVFFLFHVIIESWDFADSRDGR